MTGVDYVVVNTKGTEKLSLVVEYLLVVKEIIQIKKPEVVGEENKEQPPSSRNLTEVRDFKRFGIGYSVISIFKSPPPVEVPIEQGTPR